MSFRTVPESVEEHISYIYELLRRLHPPFIPPIIGPELLCPCPVNVRTCVTPSNSTQSGAFADAVANLNPYLWWRLRDVAGTTAIDSSGNGFDGTAHGGVVFGTEPSPLGDGTAARFDGTNDYIDRTGFDLTPSKQITIITYLNWDTYADDGRGLLDNGTAGSITGFDITPNANFEGGGFFAGLRGADSGSGGFAHARCARPPATTWILTAVTFDIDNLQQNSNSIGPRPKIRIFFGDTSGCTEQTLTWYQDSGFTQGQVFPNQPLRLMTSGSGFGKGAVAEFAVIKDYIIDEATFCGLLAPTVGEPCGLNVEDDVLLVDSSAGNSTVTLPAAALAQHHIFYVKKIDTTSSIITLDPDSSETIDGLPTVAILAPYDALALVSDGAAWWRI